MSRLRLGGPAARFLTALVASVVFTGCEHGESGSEGFALGDSRVPPEKDKEEVDPATSARLPFVGTWKLTAEDSGSTRYAFFYTGGTWKICDKPEGSSLRYSGSYRVSTGRLQGEMTHPDGEITATISTGTMTLDLVDYDNANNATTYRGTKL